MDLLSIRKNPLYVSRICAEILEESGSFRSYDLTVIRDWKSFFNRSHTFPFVIVDREDYEKNSFLFNKSLGYAFIVGLSSVKEKNRQLIILNNEMTNISEIDELYVAMKKRYFSKLNRNNAQKLIANIYQKLGKSLQESQRLVSKASVFKQLLDSFLKVKGEAFHRNDLDSFFACIEKEFIQHHLFEKFSLVSVDDLAEEEFQNILHLEWISDDLFLSFVLSQGADKDDAYYAISLIIELLSHFYHIHGSDLEGTKEQFSVWESAIENLPFAVTVVSGHGDILVCNSKFTQLNVTPKDCVSFSDNEVIAINDTYYKVRHCPLEEGDSEQKLYMFHHVNEDGNREREVQSISSAELGIISSSIAHELNNPLAGILAAINLLELEDWDEENKQVLEDMKNSATRCKGLVEIFLSFSKSKLKKEKKGVARDAVKQSLELLRFRMIESNVRFRIKEDVNTETFCESVNLSLCTMTLYMLLGEVLTNFNHQKIVMGTNEQFIDFKIEERENFLCLHFEQNIELQKYMKQSKLIQYLIDVQGMTVQVEEREIRLQKWQLS